jgi:hypothetical protein
MLAEGAVVALHDTFPENCPWLGPRYLMEQLNADPARYSVLSIRTPDGLGVGLIQKNALGSARLILPSLLDEIGERLRYYRTWYKDHKV